MAWSRNDKSKGSPLKNAAKRARKLANKLRTRHGAKQGL